MHAAQRTPAPVERNIALNHLGIQPAGFEFPLTEGTRKKSALIFVQLRFYNESTWQLSLRKNQDSPAATQICIRRSSRAAQRRSLMAASEDRSLTDRMTVGLGYD